jgi:hypothetical protein
MPPGATSNDPTVPEAMWGVVPKNPCTAPEAILPEPMSPELTDAAPGVTQVKSSRNTLVPSGVPATANRPATPHR